MRPPLSRVVDAEPAGIVRCELPTPFPVGPVNAYLFPDHPVTLVDPGMLWEDTPARIEALLAGAGRRVEDVELVVVTHGHPDHMGAAGWVAHRSGAPIVCGRPEERKLVGAFRADEDPSTSMLHFAEHLGFPVEFRGNVPGYMATIAPMLHDVGPDDLELVDDGDTIEAGGRSWRVLITPGHSAGHVSLHDPETGSLLSGDHLLAAITPNPLIEPDPTSPMGRRRSLVEYLDSLDRFVGLTPEVVLPGHGANFTELEVWSTAVRRHHEARAESILDAVRELGSPNTYELSCHLFPEITGFSHILGMSEVIGHLDLLGDAGAVQVSETLPLRFEVA